MYFEKEIDSLMTDLNENENLKSIRFIKGFPNSVKATILKGVVATLSPAGLDMESISVDNEDFYGQYSIDIDVFASYEIGCEQLLNDAEKIVRACICDSITGIRIGAVEPYEQARCYKVKIGMTFLAGYQIGG